MYYMYEFSECFMVLDGNNQFGSIFNYVAAGIITFEQAVGALIGG